jgi:hypothetical protein
MVDETPDDTGLSQDGSRPKRTPPTIDLEATDVTEAAAMPGAGDARAETGHSQSGPSSPSRKPILVSAVAGTLAALIVMGAAELVGWSVSPLSPSQPAGSALDDLATRMSHLESAMSKPSVATPDSTVLARIDALQSAVASLRNDFAASRGQAEKLKAAVDQIKSAPAAISPAPDLSAVDRRLDQIEGAVQKLGAAQARQAAPPAGDVALRRVVAAMLLTTAVHDGHPYAEALAASKSLIPDADALKPLETFATSGVPSAPALCRELLAIVPKLAPARTDAPAETGIIARLQQGAEHLVKIERTDVVSGNSTGAILARVTAAALHNDLADARRELNALSPTDRAAAAAWIAKVDARDAALDASRRIAADAMAALAQPVR